MLWLLLSCAEPPGPATPGSRSAELSIDAAALGRDATLLSLRTEHLEGRFDALRAAPPEEQAAIQAEIHAEALAIQAEAEALRARVEAMEVAARVWE